MKRAKLRSALHLLGFLLAASAAAALFVASGSYDISALRPHTMPVHRILTITRDRSIERRSQAVQVPALGGADQLARGMTLLREHCVRCHGAPGIAPEPFALGLQPLALPLAQSARELDARALYWIVRNGIKMTAMPAFEFRLHEQDLWAIVAAVRTLPTLSPAAYRAWSPGRLADDAPEPALPGIDAARGRLAIGQYGCPACHTIPGWPGREARVGPPLEGIAARATLGGVLRNSPENMIRWLRSPQAVAPLTAMPDLGVTERDAQDIAAYLGTLK